VPVPRPTRVPTPVPTFVPTPEPNFSSWVLVVIGLICFGIFVGACWVVFTTYCQTTDKDTKGPRAGSANKTTDKDTKGPWRFNPFTSANKKEREKWRRLPGY